MLFTIPQNTHSLAMGSPRDLIKGPHFTMGTVVTHPRD